MKKTFLSMLLAAALIVTSTGCSKPAEPAAPAATDAPAKTKVTLGLQADAAGGIQKVIAAFQEEYPQYEVDFANMTNDSAQMHDQLLNSLSSKSDEYDVVGMDVVWAGEFAAAGYLEPLDQMMMDQGLKPSDFNAGSMASGKYEGKNYALPYFPDLGFLYYRKDIVSPEDTAKLEGGTATWADLKAMAEKYAGQGGTKTGIVYQSKQYEGLVCNLNEFSNNWADIEGGLKMMKDFTDSDKATPEDILVYTEGETHAAFVNGDSVFARNWPYMLGIIKGADSKIKPEQVGFAPLPTGGTVGGWLLGINKNTDNMQGAQDFINFLSGEKGQRILSTNNGSLPGINSLLTDAELIKANPLMESESFRLALEKTIARPVVPNYSEVSDKIQVATHKYLSGSMELGAAAAEIKSALGK